MNKPEIKIDEWLAGPQGMTFEIYPVKDVHTQQEVEAVKQQLYRDRDVVGHIRVTWLHDPKLAAQFK